jgi:hypothetical protein
VGHRPSSGLPLIVPLSYQSIVATAQALAPRPDLWDALAIWIERKIAAVAQKSHKLAVVKAGRVRHPELAR